MSATVQKAVFKYDLAFSRTIGWVTEDELKRLKEKRIAIAGMGGVGGIHLITLVRLGISRFRVADFDTFAVENFNRQAGASMETVGLPKVSVMSNQALAINPEASIEQFDKGVTPDNVDEFLKDVDLYIDGLDAFALDARSLVFKRCHELGIPAITVAPIGMGAALLVFMPNGMSFENYFGWGNHSREEKLLRFALGLSPKGLHRRYLVVPSTFDIANSRAPSTPMGCQLSAGVAAAEALKILLNRGPVLAAPRGVQYDAYLNKVTRTWIPWGAKNPLQRLRLFLARKIMAAALAKK